MAILTAEIISPELLKNQAGPEVFHQGQQLYRWGRVVVEKVLDDSALCKVNEGHPYEVTITLTDRYLYLKCECRYAQKGKICEHDVAAALAVQEYLRKSQSNRWQNRLQKIIQISQNPPRHSSNHPYLLFFSLQNATNLGLLNWKIAPYHLPLSGLPKEVRSQVSEFNSDVIQAIIQKYPGILAQVKSPYHALNPDGCLNSPPESVVLANLIQDRSKNYFYSNTFPIYDYLSLVSASNSPVFFGTTLEPLQKAIQVFLSPGQVQLFLEKENIGLRISASIKANGQVYRLNAGDVQVISYNPFLLLVDQYVLRIEGEEQIELLKNFSETPQIIINTAEVPDFLEKFYLPLAQQAPLAGDAVSWEDIDVAPVNKIYLSEVKGELLAQLRFGYGEFEVTYDSRFPEHRIVRKPDSWTLVRITRQPHAEEQAYKKLSSNTYGLKRSPLSPQPGTFTLRSRTHPVDFLLHSVPALARDGFEIFGEERLKSNRVNRNKPTLSFHVSSGIDWFDVKVAINYGENEVSLKDLRRTIRKKEKYLKLADGTIGEIPEEWLTQYRHLFALGEESETGIRLSKHHISIIDQLVDQTDQAVIDEEFLHRREKLRNFIENGFEGIQHQDLPKGLIGELRPYQKSGYDWLYFLHDFGFGGCLADDMGLGKTIQALTFFQSIYERGIPGGKASLVIVPRSLLANWQREASRFTPGLRILEYFESSRPKDLRTFDDYDLVITTYGVMLRDIEGLRTYPFYYVLLDESQLIKNPFAQTAKAARLLNPRHRLVLTGTPVENSTIELWSQFAFLNPGLLGNLDYFKSEFSNQIERQNNDTSAQFLRKLIYPFILRRTKDQVAPELPPRSERILYSDMELAQRKLYNRTRDYYRGMLLGMLESEGTNGARMKVLEGLLRLRQICNHPGLVDEHFRGESGKFELILETLDTLKNEGHKALVFSQFVQMLTILRKELDARGIRYEYLDGQTQDRQDRVDTFQNNPQIPFFLISLKAGGLGLNLTAADYVIHIDPGGTQPLRCRRRTVLTG